MSWGVSFLGLPIWSLIGLVFTRMTIFSSGSGKFSCLRLRKYSLWLYYNILPPPPMSIIQRLDRFMVSPDSPIFFHVFFKKYHWILLSGPIPWLLALILFPTWPVLRVRLSTEVFTWCIEFFISSIILVWVFFSNSIYWLLFSWLVSTFLFHSYLCFLSFVFWVVWTFL